MQLYQIVIVIVAVLFVLALASAVVELLRRLRNRDVISTDFDASGPDRDASL
ncbi:hypothetical protein GCM10022377_26850 [Zhihengliuella alba]|uniref:Uncharacterized protein n=1 Tax=Zhihengliuella alba TaxID=547018 RepID=A0ABP7E0S8_9MICC